MVLDPDMLLQLAKKSAETSPAAGGGGGRGGRGGKGKKPRTPPVSTVDAWKSINGRPFARWIDPTVDVYDARFGNEGPSNAEWLQLPPLEVELDRAAGVMEVRCEFVTRHKSHPQGERVPVMTRRKTLLHANRCLLYTSPSPRD